MSETITGKDSLSQREKGDLYWKKLKYLEQAERHITSKDGKAGDLDISDILKNPELTEIAADNVASKERKHSTLSLQSYGLKPGELDSFKEHISENYMRQIKNRSLKAIAFYEGEKAPDNLFGVSVTAEHGGFMELVWVSVTADHEKEGDVAELLRFIYDSAEKENRYKGIFMELHKGYDPEWLTKAVEISGMEVRTEPNNIFECRLSDVTRAGSIMDAADKIPCVPLKFATDDQKKVLEDIIAGESKPIPVPVPIPWKNYNSDISVICCSEKGNLSGAFFVSGVRDYLVVDLLYGSSPAVSAALIGSALKACGEDYDPESKLLFPVVSKAACPLIEKLVKGAKRGELTEAVIRF